MKCYNCNSVLEGTSDHCVKCGADVSVYRVVVQASNAYYNEGLEKAKVRDLSGAVASLNVSIQINKNNVKARNLLGLVYYEMGEIMLALSEWVISKNIRPDRNVACVYIENVQADLNKLDAMNQAIKKYNISLGYAKEGNVDMALIQLKKVTVINPKFIKAKQLLALLYIQTGNKDRAVKMIKQILKQDRNNTLALKYLSEIEGESADARRENEGGQFFKHKTVKDIDKEITADKVMVHTSYKEPENGMYYVLSILIGVVLGAALIWYLVVPSKLANVNYEKNQVALDYSGQLSANSVEITNLNSKIDTLTQEKDELLLQLETYKDDKLLSDIYNRIISAAKWYIDNNYTMAAAALYGIDRENILWSDEAKTVYDTIYADISVEADNLKKEGIKLYEEKKYTDAFMNLKAAAVFAADDEIYYYIYASLDEMGMDAEAYTAFKSFIKEYPTTLSLADAQYRISQLKDAGVTPADDMALENALGIMYNTDNSVNIVVIAPSNVIPADNTLADPNAVQNVPQNTSQDTTATNAVQPTTPDNSLTQTQPAETSAPEVQAPATENTQETSADNNGETTGAGGDGTNP